MAARAKDYDAVIAVPFGALGIEAGTTLTAIDFLPASAQPRRARTPLAREVCVQLRAYLRDGSHQFDLPLDLAGTDYQRRVWRALIRIPPGRPLSYGALATRLASGARAVGGACRANPVPVIVPCHRVVASAGLGGFMGGERTGPLSIKQWLLAHEHG